MGEIEHKFFKTPDTSMPIANFEPKIAVNVLDILLNLRGNIFLITMCTDAMWPVAMCLPKYNNFSLTSH